MRSSLLVATAVLGIAACGGRGGDDVPSMYESIEVDPPVASLTVALGTTATQDYTIYGLASGYAKQDITAGCTLSVEPIFGAFEAATLTVQPHGGKTNVLATCEGLQGTGVLNVNLTGSVTTGMGVPANAADLFANAATGTDPARTPVIEYPIDKAVSPRNIPPIEVQHTAAGSDLFHTRLTSSFLSVDVYSITPEAMLSAKDWEAIAFTAAGDNLAIAVEGLAQAAPATKFASAPIAITMSNDTIDQTAIYYWASSQGNVMSQVFGDLAAPSLVKDDCTSCHSVSRNGTRIGYSRCVAGDCGQLYAGFLRYDGATQTWNEAVNANAKAIKGSYTTFAPIGNPFPDDSKAVAMVGMSTGSLALYDPDTGAAIPSNLAVAQHGPGMPRSALMPDWSHDGKTVVFASSPAASQWIDLADGRIATMSYTYAGGAHTFGEPTFIVPAPITLANGTYTNFFFPSFSPDGQLIVFNAARAGWRNFVDAKTAGQRLMLTTPTGAMTTDLTAMNGGLIDADITWAHWAPTISSDYYWIVFSSERDYGHRTTVATSPAPCRQNGVKQCKQIWLGAIARNKLGTAADPSAPPMWLPGQSPTANNISPYWSLPAQIQ